jgi:hypothetical protein
MRFEEKKERKENGTYFSLVAECDAGSPEPERNERRFIQSHGLCCYPGRRLWPMPLPRKCRLKAGSVITWLLVFWIWLEADIPCIASRKVLEHNQHAIAWHWVGRLPFKCALESWVSSFRSKL